ncbi:hypothetical protein ON010_g13250 [Phytophthora cinnamomi]|nr:hypothetical protein ON010_g13250 [Phytophthora cinnamomi]
MGDGARALLRATESKGFSARNVTAPGLSGVPAHRLGGTCPWRARRVLPFPGRLVSWRYLSTPYNLCLSGADVPCRYGRGSRRGNAVHCVTPGLQVHFESRVPAPGPSFRRKIINHAFAAVDFACDFGVSFISSASAASTIAASQDTSVSQLSDSDIDELSRLLTVESHDNAKRFLRGAAKNDLTAAHDDSKVLNAEDEERGIFRLISSIKNGWVKWKAYLGRQS